MSAFTNRIKVKLKPGGKVELRLERRDQWGRVTERTSFTISRRLFENAMKDATIEAPWKELMSR